MARSYLIHAGAHRTGSSSFQLCLQRNREALEAAGYVAAFPSRDGVRAGQLALRLPAPRHGSSRTADFAARIREHIAAEVAPDPGARVVLSEENILGSMVHFEQAAFYPAAAQRFAALRAGLETAPAHVLLAVRSYPGFFKSCYRKRAEETVVIPFRDTVPYFLGMDRGWAELAADLLRWLQPERLTVVRHEARMERRGMLSVLAEDLPAAALKEPRHSLNVAATDSALEALQRLHASGAKVTRKDRRKLIEDFQDQREPLGVSQYQDIEAQALEIRYQRDLDRLAAMPGVTLL